MTPSISTLLKNINFLNRVVSVACTQAVILYISTLQFTKYTFSVAHSFSLPY